MKDINFAKKVCYIFASVLLIACNFSTFATDYRGSWMHANNRYALDNEAMVSFHRSACDSVVKAQRFCADKNSNIAAFAICLHASGGDVKAIAQLPYVVSSGDQKATNSGISTVLVKEMFLKSGDNRHPLDVAIQFVTLVMENRGGDDLDEIKNDLIDRKKVLNNHLAVPDLTFSKNPEKDKLFGSILHCEQAILIKCLMSDRFLADWIAHNFDGCTFESNDFLSLDIITYDDMCPKCFSTCKNAHKSLQKKINNLLRKETNCQQCLTLKILISSFRPYAVGKGQNHTRVCATCASPEAKVLTPPYL